jgi:hypothetical protein
MRGGGWDSLAGWILMTVQKRGRAHTYTQHSMAIAYQWSLVGHFLRQHATPNRRDSRWEAFW